MARAILRQLSSKKLISELNTQINHFVEAMGCLPRFIDGHQHVHQFPVIRDALIEVYEQRLNAHKPYIRLVNAKLTWRDWLSNSKKMVIHAMGASALKRRLIQYNIPHNKAFSGIYSFVNSKDYPKLFPFFLQEITDKGLIMCHPGLLASVASDSIAEARYHEYQYFTSQQFLADCRAQGVVVGRFSDD